jgi:aminopeptidase N
MKKNYFLLALLCGAFGFAQSQRQHIADMEMKSAAALQNVAVNPDTWNYDVTYHKLEFEIDPADYFISGTVTTTFTALENMGQVVFDLSGDLFVSSVLLDGNLLDYAQSGDELVITLPSTLNTGASATVVISYFGQPPFTGLGSFVVDDHNGTPVLWTLSEPFGARDWWPCKQDLNDKIDNVDIYITAPSEYVSVANGLEQSQTDNGNGTTTTWFRHNYAIPAYLVAIACTNYTVFTQQAGLGTAESPFFPIVNYAYPETAANNQASVAVTPGIMNFYEEKFGPYPFRDEKYGHAQFHWGGGMEHTTVSFMSAGFSGGYSRELIAHELGHQWFGDKVTCGSWKDIWLNEGFATYLAAMVIEEFDGAAAFTSEKNSMIDFITTAPGGAVYLTDAEALDVDRIFSSRLTYDKGAMVLNMLRFKLGDTAFFAGLEGYLSDTDLAYAYATTPDLQAHLESASGVDLDEFFNDWVYHQGYPSYNITAHNLGNGQTQFTVNQTTSHPSVSFFEMPVPLRVFGTGGQQLDVVLDNTSNGQNIVKTIGFNVTSLQFDPTRELIARNNVASLGLGQLALNDAVSLYPNPAGSALNLDIPSGVTVERAEIRNMLGQTVARTTSQTGWDVSGLASGVHFLTLTTSAGSKTLKFVKN